MSNRPGAWQRRRPHKRQKAHHQACPGMRPESSTLSRIKAELAELEELGEDSPHLVAPRPTTQWLRRNPTTLWGHLDHHLQHLAQEVLVC